MRSKYAFPLLVLICVMNGALSVFAQEADLASTDQNDSFNMVLKDAEERFGAGDYEEAAALFEIAFELEDSAELLYKIARCYELLDNVDEALLRYETYLDYPGASGKLRADALNNIVELKRNLAEKDAAAKEGTEDDGSVSILDDSADDASELDDSAMADTAAEETEGDDNLGLPADDAVLETTPEAETLDDTQSPPEETPAPDGDRRKKIVGWSLVGAGGTMMLIGMISGGMAAAAKNDYENAGQSSDRIAYRNDMERRAAVFDVTFWSGLAVAGAGAALLVVRGLQGRSEQLSHRAPVGRFAGKSAKSHPHALHPSPVVLAGAQGFAVGLYGQF